jgi:hypothetical protein
MSVDSDGCGWKAGSTSTLHVHSISSMLYFLHWPQCGFTLSQRTLRLWWSMQIVSSALYDTLRRHSSPCTAGRC